MSIDKEFDEKTNDEGDPNKTLLYTYNGEVEHYPESPYELDKDKVLTFIKEKIKEVVESVPNLEMKPEYDELGNDTTDLITEQRDQANFDAGEIKKWRDKKLKELQ